MIGRAGFLVRTFGWVKHREAHALAWYRRAASSGVKAAGAALRRLEPPSEVRFSVRPSAEIEAAPRYSVRTEPAQPSARFSIRAPEEEREDTDDVAVTFGRRAEHRITTVGFERASATPDAVIRIRYDTRRGLEARGIGCPIPAGWDGGDR